MTIDGLVLESKYPELQYIVKGPRQTQWRDGYPMETPKHIVISFDRYLCVLDDLIRDQEWTEEDKLYISKSFEASFNNPQFVDFWVHEAPKLGLPWPTYNDTHHNQVAVVAQSIGLVAEALTYEQRGRPGGPRESVVKKLKELLDGSVSVEDDDLAAV